MEDPVKLTTPLPILSLDPNVNVRFITRDLELHTVLASEPPEFVLFMCSCSKKKNKYTVSISFSSEQVEHTCTCSDEQQGWLNAYYGAYACSMEGISNPSLDTWINEVYIVDPVGSSAWIIQHMNSDNPVLKGLAKRAHKKLIALEDSCTESKKKSKR